MPIGTVFYRGTIYAASPPMKRKGRRKAKIKEQGCKIEKASTQIDGDCFFKGGSCLPSHVLKKGFVIRRRVIPRFKGVDPRRRKSTYWPFRRDFVMMRFLTCRKKSNLHQAAHHQAPQLQSFSTTKINSTVLSETSASSLCVAVEQ